MVVNDRITLPLSYEERRALRVIRSTIRRRDTKNQRNSYALAGIGKRPSNWPALVDPADVLGKEVAA